MKKTISGLLLLALLCTSILILAFHVQPAKAQFVENITILADGSIDPPSAPVYTVDNITYILTDNVYISRMDVERSNIVIDGDWFEFEGDNTGGAFLCSDGIDLLQVTNVTIMDTGFQSEWYGINLGSSSSDINIIDNYFTGNTAAIYADGSHNNNITENYLAYNNCGILFEPSDCNNINANYVVANSGTGIVMSGSSGNAISGNVLEYDFAGILFGFSQCNDSIVSGNEISQNTDYGIIFLSLSSFNNITIVGNNITSDGYAVEFGLCSNSSIIGNNITDNTYGATLYSSQGNNIAGNNIADNVEPIEIDSSPNNSIAGNNITNNYLNISSSDNTSVTGNTFVNCGLLVQDSYQNFVEKNIVNGMPLVYLENTANNSVTEAGQVILVNCSNMMVENLDLSGTTVGIELIGTSNSIVSHNNATQELDGIWILLCNNDSINQNYVDNNSEGILLESSSNNSITGNQVTNNSENGIGFINASNNNAIENNIAGNAGGIAMNESFSNSIIGNNLTDNGYGIIIRSSCDNNIYHNDFDNNTSQVSSYQSINAWDDGYPQGGNYWSDYNGTDWFSGPFQNETGSDGIADTPYFIAANNFDNYPLIPGSPQTTIVSVGAYCDTLNTEAKAAWITFHTELPEGYSIENTDLSSLMLRLPYANCAIQAEPGLTSIEDPENNHVSELTVTFDRTALVNLLLSENITFGNVTLSLTGQLFDGTQFEGSCSLSVSSLIGDVNCDGKVDLADLTAMAFAFHSQPGDPNWNDNANFAPPYNTINLADIVTLAAHYGQQYP